MARIRYTVTVRNYTFNPPSQITESEYWYFKSLISSNPNVKLNEPLPESPIKKGLRIAALVALSPLIILSGQGEGELKSEINRRRAQSQEDAFYATLKELVIDSNSFEEFASMVKEKFSYYR